MPCVACRSLVEMSIGADGRREVVDQRVGPDQVVYAPPLCWGCRGAVFLDPPDPSLFRPVPGPWGRMGLCWTGPPPEGANVIPILRVPRLHGDG